jgi:hypothetical protein
VFTALLGDMKGGASVWTSDAAVLSPEKTHHWTDSNPIRQRGLALPVERSPIRPVTGLQFARSRASLAVRAAVCGSRQANGKWWSFLDGIKPLAVSL